MNELSEGWEVLRVIFLSNESCHVEQCFKVPPVLYANLLQNRVSDVLLEDLEFRVFLIVPPNQPVALKDIAEVNECLQP